MMLCYCGICCGSSSACLSTNWWSKWQKGIITQAGLHDSPM